MAKQRKPKSGGNSAVVIIIIFLLFALLAVGAFLIIPSILKKGNTEESSGTQNAASSSQSESLENSEEMSREKTPEEKLGDIRMSGLLNSDEYVLVNKDHPLPESFQPALKEIPAEYRVNENAKEVHTWAYEPLIAMIKAAAQDGISLRVTSSYRSVTRQKELFEAKTAEFMETGLSREAAEEEAAKLVAIPGTSEHATGLALDIVSADYWQHNDDLYETFEETPEFAWLSKNAHTYGFILRFPKGAENITGISYEPWHYRFVGANVATAMKDLGVGTLEELHGVVPVEMGGEEPSNNPDDNDEASEEESSNS